MKILKVVTFCAATALPHLVNAAPAADASALGTVDAITSYCEKLVPSHASQIAQRANAMFHGRSNDADDSHAYRESYTGTMDQLSRTDKTKAIAACTAFAEGR